LSSDEGSHDQLENGDHVTNQAVGERGCSRLRVDGQPCRGKALPGLGLCSFHARLEADPHAARIAGRRGAKAKRAKPTKGSLRDAIRRRIERDPDHYAEKLLESGARGIELADRIVADEQARAAENRGSGPLRDPEGRTVGSLADLIAFAVRQDRAGNPTSSLVFGVELPEAVKDAILEADDRRRGLHSEAGS
jgi:hypothetical protein